MNRPDARRFDELRPVSIELGLQRYAEGSALIRFGETMVLCAASVEERVPPFLMLPNRQVPTRGWVTAEYAMLPRATNTRTNRTLGGREKEIQRLIGRALRAAVDMEKLGPRTITVDCDVLVADGGTRTAAITGGFVALALAVRGLMAKGLIKQDAIVTDIAAISVGVVKGEACLDLCYAEDSSADVDMNIVMTGAGKFVEVQGTGEGATFDKGALEKLCDLATIGCAMLARHQREALAR